jgi:hypothetical protein
MLHFVPQSVPESRPQLYAEAVSRLASIRHALRLVEPFAGGPASDIANDDERIAEVWESSSEAKQRCFGKRGERVIAGTSAGLEALLAEREAGREPNSAASRRLAEEIRAGLEDVSRLMLGGPAAGAQFPPDSLPFAL